MNENCITCDHFAWWDKDYCCLASFKILCHSEHGEFNDDILRTMKTAEECCDYTEQENPNVKASYQEAFEEFLKEKKNG